MVTGALLKLVQRDFDRAATHYDAAAELQRRVLSHCTRMLAPHVPQGADVVDAGCGTGAFSGVMEEAGRDWRVTAVDIAPGMCRQAQLRGPRVACADIAQLPLPSGRFDGAICSLVLQWVEDWPRVFAEFRRVLKPGGVIAVSTFGAQTLKELRSHMGEAARVHPFVRAESIREQAERSGLRVLHLAEDLERRHYAQPKELFAELKTIGAVNKQAERPRGLTTPSQMQDMMERYARLFACPGGVYASWQVFSCLLVKDA